MSKTGQDFSLKELIEHCMDSKSSHRQAAWREFVKKYNVFIYQNVTRYCYNWRIPRLKRQLSDVVNDIIAEIYVILCSALSGYRELENEKKFKLWLATICSRTVSRYIQREFIPIIANPDIDEFKNFLSEMDSDNRWEIYEMIIEKLRNSKMVKKRYLERDINIFLLYVWADFNNKMILSHPCYVQLGHRVIDNVVNRMRNILK